MSPDDALARSVRWAGAGAALALAAAACTAVAAPAGLMVGTAVVVCVVAAWGASAVTTGGVAVEAWAVADGFALHRFGDLALHAPDAGLAALFVVVAAASATTSGLAARPRRPSLDARIPRPRAGSSGVPLR